MSLGFVSMGQSALIVGRTPWSAADALVGLPWADDADSVGEKRVQGGPPHNLCRIRNLGKTK
jgi:hypothetical protein